MQHLSTWPTATRSCAGRRSSAPGPRPVTVLDLTYNSLEKKSESPAGNNFSLVDLGPHAGSATRSTSTRTRRTRSPAASNKYVELTDGDGTTHRFTGSNTRRHHLPGGARRRPPVPAHARPTDPARRWALTRPDRVTFFYDPDGYPTVVEDRNGNTLTFTLEDTPPAEDPGRPEAADHHGDRRRRVARFTIDYWARPRRRRPHVRGKIKRITDHTGSALDFEYYDDGNLRKLIQRGGTNADGTFLADRSFVFTYTTQTATARRSRLPPIASTPTRRRRTSPRGSTACVTRAARRHSSATWAPATGPTAGSSPRAPTAPAAVTTTPTTPSTGSRPWRAARARPEVRLRRRGQGHVDHEPAQPADDAGVERRPHGHEGHRAERQVRRVRLQRQRLLKTDEWDQDRANRTSYEYENLPVQNARRRDRRRCEMEGRAHDPAPEPTEDADGAEGNRDAHADERLPDVVRLRPRGAT